MLCFFFTVFTLSIGTMSAVPIKKDASDQIVPPLNALRLMVSHTMQVGNMWKIEWSDSLIDKIKNRMKTCEDLKYTYPGDDYRILLTGDKATMERQQAELASHANDDNYMDTMIASSRAKSLGVFEMFHPRQTSIGCVNMECQIDQDHIVAVCAIGPFATLEKNDFWHGKPGCGCSTGKIDNGLCSMTSGVDTRPSNC